jgi:hypothetical protein
MTYLEIPKPRGDPIFKKEEITGQKSRGVYTSFSHDQESRLHKVGDNPFMPQRRVTRI